MNCGRGILICAVRPWNSVYAERMFVSHLHDPDAETVERCMCCTHTEEECARCDGRGNIGRRRGRQPKNERSLVTA